MALNGNPYWKPHYRAWGSTEVHLTLYSDSSASADDPRYSNCVKFTVKWRQLVQRVGAPTRSEYERRLPPGHHTWVEDLDSFTNPERTPTWRALAASLVSIPHIRHEARNFIEETILVESRDAARRAAAQRHQIMWVVADWDIKSRIPYWPHVQHFGRRDRDHDDPHQGAAGSGAGDPNLAVANFMGRGSPTRCTVCLGDLESGSLAGWLPCSHVFHPVCITQWLQTSRLCPICRLQLP
ncbi:uncharacterized protein LOC120110386 [Phoenix dactylifera]|uniref:Uncharacterized protein LOC120110386 n=1 Tax=Phoenix dactylifera TaxID=42345 RepID=A0A8B9AD26_PHODC|nr:uncharacterized protein LOC120110386 [Phoenix dactylifera]